MFSLLLVLALLQTPNPHPTQPVGLSTNSVYHDIPILACATYGDAVLLERAMKLNKGTAQMELQHLQERHECSAGIVSWIRPLEVKDGFNDYAGNTWYVVKAQLMDCQDNGDGSASCNEGPNIIIFSPVPIIEDPV